jgi:hypothetical protein
LLCGLILRGLEHVYRNQRDVRTVQKPLKVVCHMLAGFRVTQLCGLIDFGNRFGRNSAQGLGYRRIVSRQVSRRRGKVLAELLLFGDGRHISHQFRSQTNLTQ